MKLLYVADGRSPIARSWIEYFVDGGHEVHLVSSRPAPALDGLASQSVVPVAFSGRGAASGGFTQAAASIPLRTFVRHWAGPLTVPRAGRRLRATIEQLRPELVHALRLPFEGAMAAAANPVVPLILSTWGNDFTLHAPASPLMGRMTRRSLHRTAALHADCRRDQRLAAQWGFDPKRPSIVIPGSGGVRREVFRAGPPGEASHPVLATLLGLLPEQAPLVLNPRGFRAYVRTDSFFSAVPQVRARHPQAQFACVAMAGEQRAERWVERLGLEQVVHLLPQLNAADMAVLMRRAQVMVSPSEHDGTPNTLLEAMASGAFPVLGRLESVAEWIEDGVNGALVDPGRPRHLAEAISAAISDPALRSRAAEINQRLIAERADYAVCMALAAEFYARVLSE